MSDSNTQTLHARLTQGSISSAMVGMAVPMSIGLFATMSFNIADSFFVSGLGETSLAALSFAFPVVMIGLAIAVGLSSGASSCVAIALGKGETDKVKDYATDAFILSIIIAAIFGVIGYLSIDCFFSLMGATPAVLEEIRRYISIWYFSTIFMITPMVALTVMRALGHAKTQGKVMVSIALVNIILDPIFIFGFWFIPAMGIEGAAVASLIARLGSFVVAVRIVFFSHGLFSAPSINRLISSTKVILRVGIPALCGNLIIPIALYFMMKIISEYGPDAVAGYGVASRIEAFVLIIFYALSSVIGPFCGQNFGAGQIDRVEQVQNFVTRICLASGAILTLVLAVFGNSIARIFSDSELTLTTMTDYLLIVPISYAGYGIVMMASSSFNGLSKPLPAMLMSATRVMFLFFPLAFILKSSMGLNGVFFALAVSNIATGLLAYFLIRRFIRVLANT